MELPIAPTASPYSPLFEMRAWRKELDQLLLQYAEDEAMQAAIVEARREVDAWIRARAQAATPGR